MSATREPTEAAAAPIGNTSVVRWWLITAVPGIIVVALLVALIRGSFEPASSAPQIPAGPSGTRTFSGLERNHVPGSVTYQQVPPVGGNHSPIWAICGVYNTAIPSELAVHAMEHGAVWVTYDATALSAAEIHDLEHLVQANYVSPERFVLLSPFQGLPTPVVVSAWGRQLPLANSTDARLVEFIHDFAGGAQAPEPGNPCFSGGIGEPIDPTP